MFWGIFSDVLCIRVWMREVRRGSQSIAQEILILFKFHLFLYTVTVSWQI